MFRAPWGYHQPVLLGRLLIAALWVALGVESWRARGRPDPPVAPAPASRDLPPWVVAAGAAAAIAWLAYHVMPLAFLGFDDWFNAALGRWIAGNAPGGLGQLFTGYVTPHEPVVRLIPQLTYALDNALWGGHFAGYQATGLAIHVLNVWLLNRVAVRLVGPRGAALATALFALHPLHAEAVAWLSARESLVGTTFVLGALRLHLGDRPRAAALLVALALVSKEQTAAILPCFVAVDLVARRPVRWRTLAWSLGALVLILAWRIGLTEPGNAAQQSFLRDLLQRPLGTVLLRIVLDVPALMLAPQIQGAWPAPRAVAAASIGVGVLILVSALRGGTRPTARWAAFAAFWIAATLGPTASEIDVATLLPAHGAAPSWNLRHLYLALVGPVLAAGWALGHLSAPTRRVLLPALAIAGALGLRWNLAPFDAQARRVRALAEALDADPLPAGAAVRTREPTAPETALLLFRRMVAADAGPGLPVLIGEPRCGCVRLPILRDAASFPTVRALGDAMLRSIHVVPTAAGTPCACTPWRHDPQYLLFDGTRLRPEGAPPFGS